MSAWLLVLAGRGDLVLKSDIMELLPQAAMADDLGRALDRYLDRAGETMAVMVIAAEFDTAARIADDLGARLAQHAGVMAVTHRYPIDTGVLPSTTAGWPGRTLSAEDRRLLAAGESGPFAEFAIAQYFSPFASALYGLLPKDPFLLDLRAGLGAMDTLGSGLSLEQGYLSGTIEGRRFVLLSASLDESGLSPDSAAAIAGTVAAVGREWMATDPSVDFVRAGTLFFSADAYARAERDMTFIGGLSLILIVLLILFVFRSFLPLAVIVLALLFAMLTAFCVVHLVFGHVHVITLVFGLGMIGVSIDYLFHYIVQPASLGRADRMQRVIPSISLGLLASVLGYLALLIPPFPGLRQMAVFCITGLCAVYVTILLLLPGLTLSDSIRAGIPALSSRLLGVLPPAAVTILRGVAVVAVPAGLAAVFLLEPVPDDVRQYQSLDRGLVAEQNMLTQVVNAFDSAEYVIVRGETAQALLENTERLVGDLAELQARGMLGAYRAVTGQLPSISTQNDNAALVRNLYASQAMQDLVQAGLLTEEEGRELATRDDHMRDQYLLPADWLASTRDVQLRNLWLGETEGIYYTVVLLQDPAAGFVLPPGHPDARHIDRVEEINGLINQYKMATQYYFMLAIPLLLLAISCLHGPRQALYIMLAPVAAIALVSLLASLSGGLDLISVLSLFLLLGLGVDYGIFLSNRKLELSHVSLATVLSLLTTIASFGLLSASSTEVIASYGKTLLSGIFFLSLFLLASAGLLRPQGS